MTVEPQTTETTPVTVTHTRNAERFEVVMLEWPVEYDGKLYDRVTVRRMSTSEVAAFVEAAIADKKAPLPMLDAPQAVLDELDEDDAVALNKVVEDFLPRSWRDSRAADRASGVAMLPSQPPVSGNPSTA